VFSISYLVGDPLAFLLHRHALVLHRGGWIFRLQGSLGSSATNRTRREGGEETERVKK
jgi:hypothetical protein